MANGNKRHYHIEAERPTGRMFTLTNYDRLATARRAAHALNFRALGRGRQDLANWVAKPCWDKCLGDPFAV